VAANGHRYPATPGHTEPRNTWSDGTSSHVWHHPATFCDRLVLKQVLGRPRTCGSGLPSAGRCHRWPSVLSPL